MAETYQPTPRRKRNNIIDTFAVVYPPGEVEVKCILSPPVALYPFPWPTYDVRSSAFEVVRFKEKDKECLRKLLPQGFSKQEILHHDFDHDPIHVTARLYITAPIVDQQIIDYLDTVCTVMKITLLFAIIIKIFSRS